MTDKHPKLNDRLVARWLGVIVLLLAAFTVVSDLTQRQCVADNFAELGRVLEVRGQLTEDESNANEAVNLIELEAETDQDVIDGLLAYRDEMRRIQRVRDANPLPPFPAGECNFTVFD